MYISRAPLHVGTPYGQAPAYAVRSVSMPVRRTLGLAASPGVKAGTAIASTAAGIGSSIALASSVGAAAGPIGAAVGAAIGVVMGLITGHHTAAVQKEAVTLNGSQPQFLQTVQSIMASLNAGQISAAAAISALQSAQSAYYSSVASIIKKGGPCRPPSTTSDPKGTQFCNYVTEDWADCATAGPCNASCAIGCGLVEPTVQGLTAIIQAGGGTFQIPASQPNGSIQGTPPITVTYNGAAGSGGITGALASAGTIAGIPTWMVYAGGGILLLVLLMRR